MSMVNVKVRHFQLFTTSSLLKSCINKILGENRKMFFSIRYKKNRKKFASSRNIRLKALEDIISNYAK